MCELHFKPSDFTSTISYQDARTGRVVECQLAVARLTRDAVPSMFLPRRSDDGDERKQSNKVFGFKVS